MCGGGKKTTAPTPGPMVTNNYSEYQASQQQQNAATGVSQSDAMTSYGSELGTSTNTANPNS